MHSRSFSPQPPKHTHSPQTSCHLHSAGVAHRPSQQNCRHSHHCVNLSDPLAKLQCTYSRLSYQYPRDCACFCYCPTDTVQRQKSHTPRSLRHHHQPQTSPVAFSDQLPRRQQYQHVPFHSEMCVVYVSQSKKNNA